MMNQVEYFKECIKNKLYFKKEWIISVFSLFDVDDHYKSILYNYKLFKDNIGYYFILDNSEVRIEGGDIKSPFFNLKDEIEVDHDLCLNTKETIKSTYARLLFNLIVLVEPFGDKIGYINKRTNVDSIESIIAERLEDNVPNRDSKHIYVDEYLKFCNSIVFLTGLMQLCVWAETPKLMLAPPGINEYKKKLLEENKDKLDDLSVVVDIEKKLIAYDNEYLKGDPGGEYFADSSKSRNIVRKKLFLMYGVDSTEPGAIAKPVINSLQQGWDIKNFPQMNDALRYGSYGRGFETQQGGELSKWLLRASSNIRIESNDCGTKLGFKVLFTEKNYKNYLRMYYLDGDKTIFIENIEIAKELIGKTITVRSAMFCKTPKTDLCQYCVGEKLAINPTALSSAIADFGSIMLVSALAKFHGKAISSESFRMDLLS